MAQRYVVNPLFDIMYSLYFFDQFVFEPTHYKNNLTKLYNIGVRMKPVGQLITKIDDEESSDEEDWSSFTNKNTDHYEEEEHYHHDDNTKVKTTKKKTMHIRLQYSL